MFKGGLANCLSQSWRVFSSLLKKHLVWQNWATELPSETAKVLSNHMNDLLDGLTEYKLIEPGNSGQK